MTETIQPTAAAGEARKPVKFALMVATKQDFDAYHVVRDYFDKSERNGDYVHVSDPEIFRAALRYFAEKILKEKGLPEKE